MIIISVHMLTYAVVTQNSFKLQHIETKLGLKRIHGQEQNSA